MKKLLLLSNIPPCGVDAGGLLVEKLCRLLPAGSLACFAAVHPYWLERVSVSPDLAWMPLRIELERPRGALATGIRARVLPAILEWLARGYAARLVAKAVEFGRTFGAEAVWSHLAGEVMIRIALPVSNALGVPLYAQVLDPPEFWFRHERVPELSRRVLANGFAAALKASAGCAAVSDPMRKQYDQAYGTKSVTILPSLDARLALPPARRLRSDDQLVIGVAGNLHELAPWNSLIEALHAADWKIAGRRVRIRLLGRSAPFDTSRRVDVEFLGWWPQEPVQLLSETDLLYCAGMFNPEHAAQARLSFPSKLAAYLAAGRPVLFHGPPYSSAVQFLRDHDAGLFCHSLDTSEILSALTCVATDGELYARLAANGTRAFMSRLTTDAMRVGFAEFLGVSADELRPSGPPVD